MNLDIVFTTIQIIVSIALVALILIQQGGTGLGSSFGGSGELYRSKRGVEKLLYQVTIITAGLFLVLSIINAI